MPSPQPGHASAFLTVVLFLSNMNANRINPKAIDRIGNATRCFIHFKHNWEPLVFECTTHWTKPVSCLTLNEAVKWFKVISHVIWSKLWSSASAKNPTKFWGVVQSLVSQGTSLHAGARSALVSRLPNPHGLSEVRIKGGQVNWQTLT